MAEKNSRRNETTDALFDAILSLESREECYAFFEDLCTVKEISDMAQRLQAAKLLLQMINRGECNERDYSLMMRPEIYQGDSIGIISSKKEKK